MNTDNDCAGDPLVLVERDGPVATVTMNRPNNLNALSGAMMAAISGAIVELDADRDIRAIVLTGDSRAFAAGADIKQMSGMTAMEFAFAGLIDPLDRLRGLDTPLIAAVAGHALGGGCELAMLCDIVVAADTARFGQPETGVGIIPGAGGTQRLVRAIGKAKAMDVILSGRTLDAHEAERAGLVARVAARETYLAEAQALARAIAARAPIAQRLARQAIDRAADMALEDGLAFERRLLQLVFASEDAREGLQAFTERRDPSWSWR